MSESDSELRWIGYGVGRPLAADDLPLKVGQGRFRALADKLDWLLCMATGDRHGAAFAAAKVEIREEWPRDEACFLVAEFNHHLSIFADAVSRARYGIRIEADEARAMLKAFRRRQRGLLKLNDAERELYDHLASTGDLVASDGRLAGAAVDAREVAGREFARLGELVRSGVVVSDADAERYGYGLRVFLRPRASEDRRPSPEFRAGVSRYAIDASSSSIDPAAGDYGRRADGSRNLWTVRLVAAPIIQDDIGLRHSGLLCAPRCVGNFAEARVAGRAMIAAHVHEWKRGAEVWIEPSAFSAAAMSGARLHRWSQLYDWSAGGA